MTKMDESQTYTNQFINTIYNKAKLNEKIKQPIKLAERERKAIQIKETMQKHYLEDIRIQNELRK
jgi:hypothetical protein